MWRDFSFLALQLLYFCFTCFSSPAVSDSLSSQQNSSLSSVCFIFFCPAAPFVFSSLSTFAISLSRSSSRISAPPLHQRCSFFLPQLFISILPVLFSHCFRIRTPRYPVPTVLPAALLSLFWLFSLDFHASAGLL